MKVLFFVILMVGFLTLPARAQDTADQPRNIKPELKQAYKEWSEKDISWLIDGRERYLKLQTDEEREKFIDDYWTSVEANPGLDVKEGRVERITYADTNFTAGVLGSKTDRGRIYLLWGGPDKTVHGRMRIAGRDESVRFEMWTCSGRDFVFIDPDETGDLRLIRDEEKVK
jgi:GWxTD domain-containing protein